MKKCSACGALYEGDLCSRCGTGTASTKPTDPPEDIALKPGQAFHGLEIVDLLGRGGMGVVYKARQPALDRLVALKILPRKLAADPDFQNRFIREAKALGALSHPNIVAVHDFGAEGDLFFFVMEFIDGVNLRHLIRERRMPSEQALKIVPQLCDALEYAHAEGVVHRDIKPENILLDKKGRVKIADFGLAKLMGTDSRVMLTQTNMVMGTPHYMAPEQVENPKSVDHRADLYSMGVVLYEMLTGELPIGRFEPPSKKVQVDVRLDEVVLKALEKDPSRRYQTAGQVKEEVTRATTVDSYKPTVITPKPEVRKRFPAGLVLGIVGAAAAAVIVLPILVFLFLGTRSPEGAPASPAPEVVMPPPAPVDLSRIYFGPDERPGGYVYDQAKGLLNRNPFPAKETAELQTLVQFLDQFGIQNVARSDVKEGYAALWFRGEAAFVALVTPVAGRLERDFASIRKIENRWTHRQGELLVLAWAPHRERRSVFLDLVERLQKKLGLPLDPPEIPFENLVIDRDEFPDGWSRQERPAGSGPGHQSAGSTIKAEGKDASIDIEIHQFAQAAEADVADKEFRGDPSWNDVLRSGRSLVALRFRGSAIGVYVKARAKVRMILGMPATTFETLVLRETEIPAGYSLAQVVNDKAAILKEAGFADLQANDVARAWRAAFQPRGAVTLLEIPGDAVRGKVRDQIKAKGAGWDSDPWIFLIEGPDDETLDALENRMREKFGWDRNRPRPVHLLHARLRPEDLPPGWTLAGETIDRKSFSCELRGPQGSLAVTMQETHDYGLLDKLKETLPRKPGDVFLAKDTVIVHVGGPEAAWGTLEILEATLRKKMRLGPPALEDYAIDASRLPKGSSYLPRSPGGNPALLKNPSAAVEEEWRAVVDPSETEILVSRLKDPKAGPAGGDPAEGAFAARYRRGPFLAIVRQPGKKDEAAFQALCEIVRGNFRLPK
jgi:tRNA A-37 threonylcarbamoyl transferase component Bud32